MKKFIFIFGLFLFSFSAVNAQFTIGFKGGLSTTDVKSEELAISNFDDVKSFGISVKEAKYGMHLGFLMQAKINKFIIQPEVVFNSNKVDYLVTDYTLTNTVDKVLSENYQHLDIPLMLGFDLGVLRLVGGPVGHVFISSSSELNSLEGFEQKFNDMTYGFQTGLGLDIGKLMIDVRYEGNFSKFGDHFTFFNHDYAFSSTPERFVASVGFRF